MAALEGFWGHCASLIAAISSVLPAVGPVSSTRTATAARNGRIGQRLLLEFISIQNMNCSGSRPADTWLRAPSRRMSKWRLRQFRARLANGQSFDAANPGVAD